MRFNQIIGQSEVKQGLIAAALEGRISHAQLFLGPEGCGNLAMALAYIQFILCNNRSETDSCGVCSSCVKNSKMVHPDVHYAFPVATTTKITAKAISDNFLPEFRAEVLANPYLNEFEFLQSIGVENKQGLISTEESAVILRKLSLKSYEADYKVMLIWKPEKLHVTASNKLLKILEEPPEKTLFLLVAESQDTLLRTVLSRTQLVKFTKINDADLIEHLVNRHGLSQNVAQQTAHLADGNYNEALKLIHADESDTFYIETFRTWMLLCYGRKLNETIKWVDTMVPLGREVQKKFLSYALRLVRESLLTNLGSHSLVKLTTEEQKFVQNFSKFTHLQNSEQIAEELNKAYIEIERNAAPKILFLDLSFRLYGLIRAAAVEQV
jgi:DNA polymerase-3 subunit delta'